MTTHNSSQSPLYMSDGQSAARLIADCILDAPRPIRVQGRLMCLYSITLAKTLMIDAPLREMQINERMLMSEPYIEAVRLATTQRDACAALLAIYTCPNTRRDVQDWKAFEKRKKQIAKLSDADLATLLVVALTSDHTDEIIHATKLDNERERMRRVMAVKRKDAKNITFGGKTLFGTFIGRLKELGYDDDEIIFRRSYSYLRLMLLDAQQSVYLTDDERNELGADALGDALFDGSNPDDAQQLSEWLATRGMKIETTQNDNITHDNGR